MSLAITEASSGKAIILKASGFIDTSTASQVEESIKKMVDEEKTMVVFDLSAVEFISSAGWGILVAYLRKMRDKGGDLRLAAMVEKVEKVFKLMEFDSLIDAYESVDEAVKSYA